MSYGIVNADQIGTSVAGSSLGAGNATLMKNRILNGNMVIDQRNAGASVTPANGDYLVDRFAYYSTQASKLTSQQNAGSVTPPTGFTKYLGFTSSSAYSVLASDYFVIQQKIEGFNVADLGWGTTNAKTITLSFQVYSSLTGTFGGALLNSASNRSYPFSYSIPVANTWTSISITIAGDTAGTWLTNNGIGITVNFALGAGSTYSGTAGAWATSGFIASPTGATSVVGTNGATFYITGVQLEVGSIATGYEYRNYQQELALCQRYYWQASYQSANTRFGTGTAAGSLVDGFQTPIPVSLRTQPTITLSNIGLYDGTTTYTISSVGTNYSNGSLVSAQLTPSSSITAGKAVQLYAINSSAVISASAEL